MKVIILAGGFGTRISEETRFKPKPMVLLDDKPIIWHIMSIYASQGFDDFVIAAGYKCEVICDWVKNLKSPWRVSVIDTGLETQTGGRISQVAKKLGRKQFMVTYGDGLGNINIRDLVSYHNDHGRLATVTAVRPPARFGVLETINGVVKSFGEKNQTDAGWINGGFFVINNNVIDEILNDKESFEFQVLPRLVSKNQLMAYHHHGFWKPMDTLREKNELSKLAKTDNPPWLQELSSV